MTRKQDDSITHWIGALREGDHEAARQLWDRYFQQLVRLAEQKLADTPRRVADEEDVAVSVFRRLCDAAGNGGLEQMQDRSDLWHLLITMTTNRVIDQQRYFSAAKRGKGDVRGDSFFTDRDGELARVGMDGVPAVEPTPAMLAELAEQHERLMDQLDGQLRQIAEWKLEQYDHEEIARRLQLTPRSVRRKVQRIREIWTEHDAQ